VVVLSIELDEGLLAEGLARELVHAIQTARKDQNCEYTDRIEVGLVTENPELREAARRFRDYIGRETLAARVVLEPLAGVEPVEVKLGGPTARLYVQVVSA
jgi:isoleucyl-tRNA synthetase